jgi:hypothetical protein
VIFQSRKFSKVSKCSISFPHISDRITAERRLEMVGHCTVLTLSVCPISNVPFVLLSQETQAFWPQSHEGGAKIPLQVCQGGCGNLLVSTRVTSVRIIIPSRGLPMRHLNCSTHFTRNMTSPVKPVIFLTVRLFLFAKVK